MAYYTLLISDADVVDLVEALERASKDMDHYFRHGTPESDYDGDEETIAELKAKPFKWGLLSGRLQELPRKKRDWYIETYIRVFDAGPEARDRFTLVNTDSSVVTNGKWPAYGCSKNPMHPHGFCQACEVYFCPEEGFSYLGKEQPLSVVPEDVRHLALKLIPEDWA